MARSYVCKSAASAARLGDMTRRLVWVAVWVAVAAVIVAVLPLARGTDLRVAPRLPRPTTLEPAGVDRGRGAGLDRSPVRSRCKTGSHRPGLEGMRTMQLDSTIQLGEPVSHRGILVAPLFPRLTPAAAYVTLDEALPLGFKVTEVDAAGLVPELAVHEPARPERAPLRRRGADRREAEPDPQRDRARRGRLEDRDPRLLRRGGTLARAVGRLRRRLARRAPGASPPQGRAALGRPDGARDRPARGLGGRARERGAPRRALADDGAGRHLPLARGRARRPARRLPAPAGPVAARCSRSATQLCLDYVSQPAAFARLYPKLLDGYLLDALGRLDGEPRDGLGEFLAAVEAAPRSHGPSAGLGEDLRLASETVLGSGPRARRRADPALRVHARRTRAADADPPAERRAAETVANLVYTLFVGIPACVMLMAVGTILCLTVIGIPLGLTCFALGFKVVTLPPSRS